MPGSADIPGLNLQFGALDFGSESAMPDFGAVENCVVGASRESTPGPVAATPAPQSQSSLYSTPLRYQRTGSDCCQGLETAHLALLFLTRHRQLIALCSR